MTRERAIEILDKIPLCGMGCADPSFTCLDCENAFLMAIEALRQREIVSCDECKWWINFTCQNDNIARQINDCGCYPDFETDGDFFCKWGEKKDGDSGG